MVAALLERTVIEEVNDAELQSISDDEDILEVASGTTDDDDDPHLETNLGRMRGFVIRGDAGGLVRTARCLKQGGARTGCEAESHVQCNNVRSSKEDGSAYITVRVLAMSFSAARVLLRARIGAPPPRGSTRRAASRGASRAA